MILTVRRPGNKTASNLCDCTGTYNDKNCAFFEIQSLKINFGHFSLSWFLSGFCPGGGVQMRLYGLLGGASMYLCASVRQTRGFWGHFGPIFIVMACESIYKSLPHFYMLQVTGIKWKTWKLS